IHGYCASNCLFTAIDSFTSATRCCISGFCALKLGTASVPTARIPMPSDASVLTIHPVLLMCLLTEAMLPDPFAIRGVTVSLRLGFLSLTALSSCDWKQFVGKLASLAGQNSQRVRNSSGE